MNTPSVPTLADVARLANVSTATVSRCLNAPERVVENTRNRVLEAVKQLGYSPNFGARALAAKRTKTIGAIIPTMGNAIFARGIQAFQKELRSHGVTLIIASSSYRADVEDEQIRTLTARGADGLLLIGYDRDPDIYRFLETQGVPVVIAWAYDPSSQMASVGFDNKAAMQELAQVAIDMGHRKIGIISAEQSGNDRARDRVLGIYAAASENGIASNRLHIIETNYGIETGAAAFNSMMQQEDRPTLVMCGNDVLAVGAIKQAKRLGLRVPHDVSITGFDDIELATVTEPELTTVHVPHRDMGRRAAQMLVGMVAGDTSAERTKLSVEVRLRGSLAPPSTDI